MFMFIHDHDSWALFIVIEGIHFSSAVALYVISSYGVFKVDDDVANERKIH